MNEVNVLLFTGGRGSRALSSQLVQNPHVRLTLAINGYDDGLSTGEVRRFLGDSLGPSDFRKNASTVAQALGSCEAALVELLDLRFPDGFSERDAQTALQQLRGEGDSPDAGFNRDLGRLLADLPANVRGLVADRLGAFSEEMARTGKSFDFSDCSLGNLVFAGCFLVSERNFNRAVDDYCDLLQIPRGIVANVTDGTNAWLVAVDRDAGLLASEADIVDDRRRNHIDEIYLVDSPPADWPGELPTGAELERLLHARSIEVVPDPALLERLAAADVIVYAPGTQHSSLLPSYMTPGIGRAIARNLSAVKVLVTNIQEDAEITGLSAVGIIDKALYYLREKNRCEIPAPFLITHYLLNDPFSTEQGMPYIPLGQLQDIEDPRLVRIANFEDGVSGVHSVEKVLMPFIESYVEKEKHPSAAIVLLDTSSIEKVSQSILEAARAGLGDVKIKPVFYCACEQAFADELSAAIPFHLVNVGASAAAGDLLQAVLGGDPDYVLLFESSGMYRGEDIAGIAALLAAGKLDAVWGSRRLSMRDIRESYHLRYQRSRVLGAASFLGSYLLSLAFMFLYGRYVSDPLSGARAIRTDYLRNAGLSLDDKRLNFNLISRILRDQGEMFESPVRFFSLSPEKANRTTVSDGFRCLVEIVKWRFSSR